MAVSTNLNRERAPGERGYVNAPDFHLDLGGTKHVIHVCGVAYKFEFSRMFGPLLLNRDGSVKATQPTREDNPFLVAVCEWADQGHRTNGPNCIWQRSPHEFEGQVQIGDREFATQEFAERYGLKWRPLSKGFQRQIQAHHRIQPSGPSVEEEAP